MTNPVDDYVSSFEGEKKEWLSIFIKFMRDNFPELEETISYQMPTYKFKHQASRNYIAFSTAKDHFTFHSLDFEMIEALKDQLPRAKFGKGSAKVSYSDREYIPILFDTARKIVERSKVK